jgi:transcriptional regulator with XRE-family HTH domain
MASGSVKTRGDWLLKMANDLGTAGADVQPAPSPSATRTTTVLLTEDASNLRNRVQALQQNVVDTHHQTHELEWRERTSRCVRGSARDLLVQLGGLGFGWRDIARLLGVSVAAVQKWRKGESISGDNRRNIAELAAACELIAAHFYVDEIASWFETPLTGGVEITPIDLWTAGRQDLLFEYASTPSDPELLLAKFDPNWRESVSSDFEVFRGDDGQLSIRPKV